MNDLKRIAQITIFLTEQKLADRNLDGRVVQLGEHLPYKQGVAGSSPVPPTTGGGVV